jgi:ribonuclease J
MNLNLYGLDGKWVALDMGVAFGEDALPGVEVVMADPAFVEARRRDLVGIVLTHAHEDHLGAVPYLWPRLRCPVYATSFTAAVLRRKLAEARLDEERVGLHEVPLGGRLELGPFDLELIGVTHSIPEASSVAIRTRLGTVLHTGDFKIDPEPLVGKETDAEAFRALGDEGVLAMVGDSTNVFRPGESGSEGALRRSLDALVAGRAGRVVVTTFASNVARIETVAKIAARHGRQLALVGRSLWRIFDAAREAGYLLDLPPFVSDGEAGYLAPDKVLVLATGSQGEPRAAMAKIAAGDHPHMTLEAGDVVVFSSKVIPGNERAIFRLHEMLVARGVEVIGEDDHFVHVSGHPSRDELARMYEWVRPQAAVPVHGERRHLVEHVAFARAAQVPHAVLVENGAVVRLAPGPAEIIGHVTSGRLALDGRTLLAADGEILRERRRLMRAGAVFVTLVIDDAGELLAAPRWRSEGVFTDGAMAREEVTDGIRAALKNLSRAQRRDDEAVREAARLVVRRAFRRAYDTRPQISVELVRL